MGSFGTVSERKPLHKWIDLNRLYVNIPQACMAIEDEVHHLIRSNSGSFIFILQENSKT